MSLPTDKVTWNVSPAFTVSTVSITGTCFSVAKSPDLM